MAQKFFEWASKALDDIDSGVASRIKEIKTKQDGEECKFQMKISGDDVAESTWINLSECNKDLNSNTYIVTIADTPETRKLEINGQVRTLVEPSDIREKPAEVSNEDTETVKEPPKVAATQENKPGEEKEVAESAPVDKEKVPEPQSTNEAEDGAGASEPTDIKQDAKSSENETEKSQPDEADSQEDKNNAKEPSPPTESAQPSDPTSFLTSAAAEAAKGLVKTVRRASLTPKVSLEEDSESIRSLKRTLMEKESEIKKLERTKSELESEIEEKSQENLSLRKVWNETRESLQRAQAAHRAGEDRFRLRLTERTKTGNARLVQRERELQEEILNLKKKLDQQTHDHQQSLKARMHSTATAERERKSAEKRVAEAVSEVGRLRDTVQQLEEKIDELMRDREKTTRQHARTLHQLRSEHEKLQAALETEKRNQGTHFSKLKNREGYLESNNAEIANALAAAQREVEEKSKELQRQGLEIQWIKADRKAAQEQLESTQDRMKLAEDTLERYKKDSNEAKEKLEKSLETSRRQIEKLSAEVSSKTLKLRDVEAKLMASPAQSPSGRGNSLTNNVGQTLESSRARAAKQDAYEERIKTMATHLLKKQEEADRLAAHRNALALQLDTANRTIRSLEKKIRNLQNNPDLAYYRDRARSTAGASGKKGHSNDVAISIAGSGTPASVARAMRFLDSFSSFISVMLRRNPAARLFFGVYVLMIHLWVLFVLFHFMAHEDDYNARVIGAGPSGLGGGPMPAPPGV